MVGTQSYPTPPTTATTSPTTRYSSDTLSSQRTHSSTSSVPVPSSYTSTRATGYAQSSTHSSDQSDDASRIQSSASHQHAHHQAQHEQGDAHGETMMEAEIERRMRKRDYAVEISRIMGRQLVTAMNGGKAKGSGRAGSEGQG